MKKAADVRTKVGRNLVHYHALLGGSSSLNQGLVVGHYSTAIPRLQSLALMVLCTPLCSMQSSENAEATLPLAGIKYHIY